MSLAAVQAELAAYQPATLPELVATEEHGSGARGFGGGLIS
jgi:hypothetical protein